MSNLRFSLEWPALSSLRAQPLTACIAPPTTFLPPPLPASVHTTGPSITPGGMTPGLPCVPLGPEPSVGWLPPLVPSGPGIDTAAAYADPRPPVPAPPEPTRWQPSLVQPMPAYVVQGPGGGWGRQAGDAPGVVLGQGPPAGPVWVG
jgi:hypothetical protein